MQLLKLAIIPVLLFTVSHAANAQDGPGEPGATPPQDPIAQLRLTPEQRQRIRAIREQNKEERAAINQRLRESNFALEQALDADVPNEAEIEQRLRDVAAAQAASTRMRVMTELSIRRVLTPDQRAMWKDLRQQAANQRQLRENPRRPGPEGFSPNQRNGLAPFPRRNASPKNPRP